MPHFLFLDYRENSLLTERLGVFYLLSQMATITVIVPINFVLNRTVTFRHATPVGSEPARSA